MPSSRASRARRPAEPGELPPWLQPDGAQACLVAVAAVPGAARSALAGLHDECLRIKLAAPPVDGRANEALLRFVATLLELPRRELSLERGPASRRKQLRIAQPAAWVAQRLAPLLPDDEEI